MKSLATKITNRLKNIFGYLFVNLRFFLRGFVTPQALKNTGLEDLLQEFKDNGFVKVNNGQTQNISSTLLPMAEQFIATEANSSAAKFYNLTEAGKPTTSLALDLNSPILFNQIFTPALYSLINGYFRGGSFKLRNNPTIEFTTAEQLVHDQELFHIDWGLRQLSVMVNLTDVTDSSSYMIYLKGSNRRYWFKHPHREHGAFKSLVKDYQAKNPTSMTTTIGPKDSMFVFDAGNGFHRRFKNGARVVLHLNFVENFVFNNWNSERLPSLSHLSLNYWSSPQSKGLEELIQKSNWPKEVFDYVLRKEDLYKTELVPQRS